MNLLVCASKRSSDYYERYFIVDPADFVLPGDIPTSAPPTETRILTFFLSCWLACSICCGLSIAIIAGVAYGYNYCLAESISLIRSDVRVYMRRGHIYDAPAPFFKQRRSGDDDDADEYQQEVLPERDSLAQNWKKDQDTRKYEEKFTEYSDTTSNFVDAEQSDKYYQQEDEFDSGREKDQDTQRTSSDKIFVNADHQSNIPESYIYYKLTIPPTHRISILPTRIIHTTVIQIGSSEIVMRKFVSNIVPGSSDEVDEYNDKSLRVLGKEADSNTQPPEEMERKTKAVSPDTKIRLEDSHTRNVLNIRDWVTSSKRLIPEYSTDVDEDNVVYRAV